MTILVALNEIANQQVSPTENTLKRVKQFLDYMGAQNPKWAGNGHFNPLAKNNFCNPTTPHDSQNEAAFIGFIGDRRRYTMEYRNARFMVVPSICVGCCGVERTP